MSGTAYDQVQGKLPVGYADLGEQQVKNMAGPVRVYRVLMDPAVAGKTIHAAKKSPRSWHWPVLAAAALLVLAGVAVWLRPWEPNIEPASVQRMALPLPDRPSIAVLPFANMSNEEGQEHFADGMTDDLITDLSKISDLFVIARNTTFVYKSKPVKIRQVAEELGVRYVLEGSVRRAGDQVRVNAQLIDALTGGHVWADRFDGSVANIFAIQDQFVARIVEVLEVRLTRGEKDEIARTKTDDIGAKQAFEEGWNLYLRFNAKDNAAAALPLQKAIALDPAYGRAYAALAFVYIRSADHGGQRALNLAGFEFENKIGKLLEFTKSYPTALGYAIEAQYHVYQGRAEDALRAAGQAIALDPNDPEAHIVMAWALTISGRPKEALNFVTTAIRLNPNYPSHYVLVRGVALFAAGDLKQAAEVLKEGVRQNPKAVVLLPPFASVLAQLGRREEARQTILSWRPAADLGGRGYKFPIRWQAQHSRVRVRLMDGLQLAALPLEITVPSLVGELTRDDPFARQVAVQRLGWFGPAAVGAVPALIDLLKDDIARNEAVRALAKIGPGAKAAIPDLVALQTESIIGFYAKEALNEIRGY